MWLNPTDYLHINDIYQVGTILSNIMDDKTVDNFKDEDLTKVESEENVNWLGLVLYQRDKKNKNFDYVDKCFLKVQHILDKTPGVLQGVINFVGPNSVTPLHIDTIEYKNVVSSWGECKTFQLYYGIKIPTCANEQIGLSVNDIVKPLRTGECLAFDGSFPHYGWNYTDFWRVSLYLDISCQFFNNRYPV